MKKSNALKKIKIIIIKKILDRHERGGGRKDMLEVDFFVVVVLHVGTKNS